MSDIAIRVENLSKVYRIGGKQEQYKTLRDTLANGVSVPFRAIRSTFRRSSDQHSNGDNTIWALKDVSFEIKCGEVVGIIGRNGAGKSTLLKILSCITEPTEGYAEIRGRVGSLLEVGTGFHPELTGRENIYLNGAILGMTRAEIRHKFDEIVAFAEVEKFIDTPVKHYSSGMYLRLAFAVAAHLEPEILLVDEVLAVGDAAFQKKCLGKMGDVAYEGRTVILVSHNMAAVRQLCPRAVLLGDGQVVTAGETGGVIREYLASSLSGPLPDLSEIKDRKGAGTVRFSSILIEDYDGNHMTGLICGQPARVILGVSSEQACTRVRVSMLLRDNLDQPVTLLDSKLVGDELRNLPADGELVCEIPKVHLAPGRYHIELYLQTASQLQDWITDAGVIDVTDGDFFGTGRALPEGYQIALMNFTWKVHEPVI